MTGRFSARGTTKPKPLRSCPTWSRRKASEAVAVLTYSMDERSAAASGATGRSRSPLAQAGVASTTASATTRVPSLSCSA